MKRTCLFLLMLPALCAAEKNPTVPFELVHKIDGAFVAGQRGRVAVPDDVFGQARNFPNDLRIVGDDRTPWPFFLYQPQENPYVEIAATETLNRTWMGGDGNRLEFDLVVPERGGEIPVHNQLELVTSGSGFIRRVEVFPVDPAAPAGRLAEGYLIDFDREPRVRNRTIRYPNSDIARLRVRIHADAQTTRDVFDLLSATLHFRSGTPVEREPVAASVLEVPPREMAEGVETHLFDLGETGRPVEYLTFDVATPSYVRAVSIHGRDTDLEPWHRVGGGEIHALEGDTENTVKFHARERFIKVQVFHHDDPPLALNAITFEAVPRYLVFEAASAGGAGLYFRAWDVAAPRHDLKDRIGAADLAALPVYPVLATAPNEAAKTQPWRNYAKLLGGGAVGAVSLLVLWIIVRMLKQQKTGME